MRAFKKILKNFIFQSQSLKGPSSALPKAAKRKNEKKKLKLTPPCTVKVKTQKNLVFVRLKHWRSDDARGRSKYGQGASGAKDHGGNWQDLEARLESMKSYLKAEAKTEKDAKALKARLNLAGEKRDLTSEEEECKKNLKAEQMQTHEGLKEIKTDLEKIKGNIDCAS